MYLPLVEPVSYSEIYVSGEVIVHESAVIAPGVILNAAPNSRIVIGAGVCIGMGSVLKACDGAIEVEHGAVLGAGVLAVGQVKIGGNACVGAATTIFNASVDEMAVIPAKSLIGDTSRQVTILVDVETNGAKAPIREPEPTHEESSNGAQATVRADSEEPAEEPTVQVESHNAEPEPPSPNSKSSVVGQVYINQLLVTLFPERDLFKRPKQNSE
jgi:carbon dioxide concentrating mechanism protein CcmN